MLIKGIPPQICTNLRGGDQNPWKIDGNLPIGGKEYILGESKITAFHLFGTYDTNVNFSVKTWMFSGPNV